jgi:hypothetical protein
MRERRWVRKWRLDAETDGLSPLPTRVVSNEEYIPLSQTGEQERVAALLQETTGSIRECIATRSLPTTCRS